MLNSPAASTDRRPILGRIRFARLMYLAILALVVLSLIATYPQTLALFQGERIRGGLQGEYGLRVLRELISLLVVLAIGVLAGTRQKPIVPYLRNAVLGLIVAGYSVTVFALTILRELPLIVPLSGLRIFQYVPLAIVGYYLALNGREPLKRVAAFLRWFVLLQAALACYQVVAVQPLFGETVFGTRAFGTFTRPNAFGVTMASCMLWFLLTSLNEPPRPRRKYRLWMIASFCIVLLTGSRLALVLGSVVLAYPIYSARKNPWTRLVTALIAPLLIMLVFAGGSQQALSGRVGTDFLTDARVVKVRQAFAQIDTVPDLLFGWGLGLTSNTLNNVAGYQQFEGQMVADSQYLSILGSFGLVGLVLYFGLIFLVARHGRRPLTGAFVIFLLLFGIPYLPLELFPANVLLLLLWGILLGLSEREGRAGCSMSAFVGEK